MAAVNTETGFLGKTPEQQTFELALRSGEAAVRSQTQTFAFGAFTASGATGTADWGTAIPAGSFVIGWIANATAGFAGDTSATIRIGRVGALSDFSATTTGSIFAIGQVGSAAVATTAACAAAVAPRITVTSGAAYSSVNAGSVTITIYYAGPSN